MHRGEWTCVSMNRHGSKTHMPQTEKWNISRPFTLTNPPQGAQPFESVVSERKELVTGRCVNHQKNDREFNDTFSFNTLSSIL